MFMFHNIVVTMKCFYFWCIFANNLCIFREFHVIGRFEFNCSKKFTPWNIFGDAWRFATIERSWCLWQDRSIETFSAGGKWPILNEHFQWEITDQMLITKYIVFLGRKERSAICTDSTLQCHDIGMSDKWWRHWHCNQSTWKCCRSSWQKSRNRHIGRHRSKSTCHWAAFVRGSFQNYPTR